MAHKTTGTRYTEEFKRQVVNLYNSGKSVIELSSEYGVSSQTIYRWISLYSPMDSQSEESITLKDYKEMQKRIAQLEMENDILKKATAIFARKQ